MAITLNILENEPINLSVATPEAMALSVGETTVIKENDYTDLINKPSIEGTELNGDVSLNALNGYTQEQIDALLSGKADTEDIPSLEGYATEQWVTDKHYLTEHQSLAGYATEQWVENKGYLTQHQSLANYYTKGQTDNLLDAKADASDIPTKTSDLTNDGDSSSAFVTHLDLYAENYVSGEALATPTFCATDATSQAVLQQAFGVTAEIVVPSNLTSTTALLYKLEPRTWFAWMSGTELEFAKMSVSVNTSNSAITLYLRGRTSIATGIMGVDSSWTVTPLASDAEGVAY